MRREMPKQWETALTKANNTRVRRVELKERVAEGDIELACELLLSADEAISNMEIIEFMKWLPGVGDRRAVKIMQPAFRWYHIGTPFRKIQGLDLQTCLKLAASIRAAFHLEDADEIRAAA
jgi:hypothetical protein